MCAVTVLSGNAKMCTPLPVWNDNGIIPGVLYWKICLPSSMVSRPSGGAEIGVYLSSSSDLKNSSPIEDCVPTSRMPSWNRTEYAWCPVFGQLL